MEEILASDAGLLDACMDSLGKFPVVMLQFPEVFALIAPPGQYGVDGLNRVKKRLPEKFYSSLIGESSNFFDLWLQLPSYLPKDKSEELLENSLIRIRIEERSYNTPLSCMGTHQGLLYRNGFFRELFKGLEIAFEPVANHSFYFGKKYSAALCTSANISGHQKGSITDLETARIFGKAAGIPLLIQSGEKPNPEKGSYPVLIPEENHILVEREGPGLEEIMKRFPEGMFIRK